MVNSFENLHVFLYIFFLTTITILKCNTESVNDSHLCKYGDTKCIVDVINGLFHKNEENTYFNLEKLDPMLAKKIHLQGAPDSPVNIDLLFTNNNIEGLSHSKVVTVRGFNADLAQEHTIVWYSDAIRLVGNYKIDGKILLLPIVGEGLSNITMVKTNFTIQFTGVPYDKEGQTYMKVNKVRMEADPERLIFKIDNLFNGDAVLSDNMNKFLNENWLDIYNEIRKPLLRELAVLVKALINRVFSSKPYDKLFLH